MDYLSSGSIIFHNEPSNLFLLEAATTEEDGVFHLYSPTCNHNRLFNDGQVDHLLLNPNLQGPDEIEPEQKRQSKASPSPDINEESFNATKKKKMIHKEIERRRRKEMAVLYGSLRSLLPIDYLKGKRSASDHVHEAANYINNLKKKIEELKERKNGLKEVQDSSMKLATGAPKDNCSEKLQGKSNVTVKTSLTGLEIVINTPSKQGLPLSTVLDVLIGEGLHIISCISAKVNENLIHTIDSQVEEGFNINLLDLQQTVVQDDRFLY